MGSGRSLWILIGPKFGKRYGCSFKENDLNSFENPAIQSTAIMVKLVNLSIRADKVTYAQIWAESMCRVVKKRIAARNCVT